MGTKTDPGRFDCYASAAPDEPIFVLLGRDAQAPMAVETWADEREFAIKEGRKPQSDLAMVHEARECADAMRRYRLGRRGQTGGDA